MFFIGRASKAEMTTAKIIQQIKYLNSIKAELKLKGAETGFLAVLAAEIIQVLYSIVYYSLGPFGNVLTSRSA